MIKTMRVSAKLLIIRCILTINCFGRYSYYLYIADLQGYNRHGRELAAPLREDEAQRLNLQPAAGRSRRLSSLAGRGNTALPARLFQVYITLFQLASV